MNPFSPELTLVAQASVQPVPNADEVLDWQRVVGLSIKHRVFPRVLRNAGSLLPATQVEQLKTLAAENSRNVLANVARTLKVVHQLENEGLHPLVIKGPLLSFQLYGDLAMRVSNDVDVMVPASEFVRAAAILSRSGYQHHTRLTNTALKQHRATEHDVAFAHPDDNILVELHADIAQPHYAFDVDLPSWWRAAHRIPVGDAHVIVPSHEHAYVIAVLHAARHRWSRLDLVADVAAFQCVSLDRAVIAKCAEQCGIMRIVDIAETIAGIVAGADAVPRGSRLAAALVKKMAEGGEFSRWQGIWVDLGLRERARDRVKYVIRRGLRLPQRALHVRH